MKRFFKSLIAATTAIVLTAALGGFTAEPALAAALSSAGSKKIQATLYADFSCGNPDTDEFITTESITVAEKPDAYDLAGLLSEWTGLDFTFSLITTSSDGEIFFDWAEDSTLVAGLDDREQKEDFFFYDSESLNWFMMDSLARTLLNNLELETLYYSVGGEPLKWDDGEMTGLTELPVDQPYMGSAFFFAHADVRGDVETEDGDYAELGDENDAYDYLYDKIHDLTELGFGLEFYGEDEIDGEDCWVFDLIYIYGEDEGDYNYVHEIAVSPNGTVYAKNIESDFEAVTFTGIEPNGTYYYDSDPENGGLTILGDGKLLAVVDEEYGEINGVYAIYGNLFLFVMEYDGDISAQICFIADESTLLTGYNQGFFRGDGRSSAENYNEDEAYSYLSGEMSALTALGFELEYYSEEEIDGENCFVFDLNFRYGDDDSDYDYVHEIAVSPNGAVYIPDMETGEFVPMNYPDADISGIYYYMNDPAQGSVTFENGSATLASGDGENQMEGLFAAYGHMLYIVQEFEEEFNILACYIADENSLLIGEDEGFYKEGATLPDKHRAYNFLYNAMQDVMDLGFYILYYEEVFENNENGWIFALYWEIGDEDPAIINYYKVLLPDGDIYIQDRNSEEWLAAVTSEYEIEGQYNFNGDPDDNLNFHSDGTLDYSNGDMNYEGKYTVFGDYLFFAIIDEEDRQELGCLIISDENTLMVEGEDGYFKE